MNLVTKFGLTKKNTLVGVEKISFFMISMQSMAMGAAMSNTLELGFWATADIPAIPVVPTAWQALAGKGNSKELAAFIARDIYDVGDTNQDICDAVAIAHYIAHNHGYMPFINKEVRLAEQDINWKTAYGLGRSEMEATICSVIEGGKQRGAAKAVDDAVSKYRESLKKHRAAAGLEPQSKARIDGMKKAIAR